MEKTIFFDLQGTLEGEATADIEQFSPYDFSKEALLLAKKGYLSIVITNVVLIKIKTTVVVKKQNWNDSIMASDILETVNRI